jgi:hypothetical protein
MDEIDFDDVEVSIENSDGSPVTVTDVLRAIADSKPSPCPCCALRNCRLMGLWVPGDSVTPEEAQVLQ